jgi:UDPglucose 6-dehydrogenase
MKIVVVGTGYVGLVTGACLADVGVEVVCVDVDAAKVERLRRGVLPIYEPGLTEIVTRATARHRLRFETELGPHLLGAEAVFIAVGTPPGDDGRADLSAVHAVATEIGRHLEDYTVVVTKSTVPVGTAVQVRAAIDAELERRGREVTFDVASNPEFLKEGAAISDFQRPDRIVVGVSSDRAKDVLSRLYRPFVLNGHPVLFMDVASAEVTKYAANAMLAVRISFMNLMAQLCEEVGADVRQVRAGIGSDPRIGSKFLYAGIGYGGSCFPKDVRALMATGEDFGLDVTLLEAVERINDAQKLRPVAKVTELLGDVRGKRIALWGLAFKPQTDDVREAPALAIAQVLLDAGAIVRGCDPVAGDTARRHGPAGLEIVDDPFDAAEGADALILATEWPEFRTPDLDQLAKRMSGRIVIDGRNALDGPALTRAGFQYFGIGQPGS